MRPPAPTVRLLVCGAADRGDDGAALIAAAHLLPALAPEVRALLEVRRCVQLDPSDLIDVGDHEACVLMDTVVGIEPGEVISIPLDELIARGGLSPRSSHALPIEQVLGIAEAIRGALPVGTFVGIGGKWFGYGSLQSRAVRASLPSLERAVADALRSLVLEPA